MNELTVFYLHNRQQNERDTQQLAHGLSDAFRDFCNETFPSIDPIDWPPLRIVPVSSTEEWKRALFSEDSNMRMLSNDSRGCILFLFDDVYPDAQGTGQIPLHALTMDGTPLMQWLYTYFPALPKIVLTTPGAVRVRTHSGCWVLKRREVFLNIRKYKTRIEHLFRSLWEPRFWHALRHYVMDEAGTCWHTPGHNAGHAFNRSLFLHGFRHEFGGMTFRADLSVSVHSLGDLSKPEARTPLADAQRLTSEIFGSAQSCYITNGTSTSNKAMLMTLLRPGETVLLDRNCHKSVHHAVVMAGAIPLYLPARLNTRLGIWVPVSLGDLKRAIVKEYPEHAKPRILVLTTCTYEGILYPVWEIARLCERHGILFYADEAWAPYLSFHPYYTAVAANGRPVRYNAIHETANAHFAVHSTHKTLAAFSQASVIHVSMRFKQLFESESSEWKWLLSRFAINGHGSYAKFCHDLHEVLRYWHSTSPHYPIMATLDCAGVQMRLEGLKLLEERLRWIKTFKARVARECGLSEADCFVDLHEIVGAKEAELYEHDGYLHDPLKIILSFKTPAACSAFKKMLHAQRIQWEKSTAVTVLFLVTIGTVEEHFEYLYRGIEQMKEHVGRPQSDVFDNSVMEAVNCQAAVLPRDAAMCDGELVELSEAEGRVSSQLLVPYPPGIPIFLPGLIITRPMIEIVKTVAATEGIDAVHGLFIRNKRLHVAVISQEEASRVKWLH